MTRAKKIIEYAFTKSKDLENAEDCLDDCLGKLSKAISELNGSKHQGELKSFYHELESAQNKLSHLVMSIHQDL